MPEKSRTCVKCGAPLGPAGDGAGPGSTAAYEVQRLERRLQALEEQGSRSALS